MRSSLYLSVLLTLGLAANLPAQKTKGTVPPPKTGAGPQNPGQPKNRRTIVDKWIRMSPEEQQAELSKLPPERRKRVEEQLSQYKSLTPQQRRENRKQYAWFSQLPPQKQNQARGLWRQFGQLPPDRQKQVTGEFDSLRAMPDADRRARLNSDEFRNKYTAHEQKILGDLSGLVRTGK